MSDVAAPMGFRPINHPSGQARSAVLVDGIASGYDTDIFKYQPVYITTDGVIAAVAAAGDFVGVFMGCSYIPTVGARAVYTQNWVADSVYVAGSMQAFYTVDPDITYACQGAGSFDQDAIGDQADPSSFTAGNALSGLSAQALDAVVGVGEQGMFRITGLYLLSDNSWGDDFTWVTVQVARHQFVANKVAI